MFDRTSLSVIPCGMYITCSTKLLVALGAAARDTVPDFQNIDDLTMGPQEPTTYPEGPCTPMGYTLAFKCALYGYFGAEVSDIWVLAPSGIGIWAARV